jgi:predicted AlkP superfamily phosphohydrolase/phosphomutase
VIDFLMRGKEGYYLAYRNRNVKTIWTLLNRCGFRQIVVNDPITFPPEEINGVMLTGFSTPPENKNFIYPKELRGEINKVCGGYLSDLDFDLERKIPSDKNEVYDLITEFAKKIYKATMYLGKKYDWDLLSVTFISTDRLQHFYFDDWCLVSSHY